MDEVGVVAGADVAVGPVDPDEVVAGGGFEVVDPCSFLWFSKCFMRKSMGSFGLSFAREARASSKIGTTV